MGGFFYFCIMKELLVRTISGAVLVTFIIACIFISPWTCWALALLVVAIGTFEISRLLHVESPWQLVWGELVAVGAFAIASLGMLS